MATNEQQNNWYIHMSYIIRLPGRTHHTSPVAPSQLRTHVRKEVQHLVKQQLATPIEGRLVLDAFNEWVKEYQTQLAELIKQENAYIRGEDYKQEDNRSRSNRQQWLRCSVDQYVPGVTEAEAEMKLPHYLSPDYRAAATKKKRAQKVLRLIENQQRDLQWKKPRFTQ